jgi:predicted permease
VVVQVALAVVLLTGAGLLGRTLLELQSVEKGFDSQGVLTFRVHPPDGRYQEPVELGGFYDRIVSGLEGLPGVTSVGATWALPFGESFGSSSYNLEGRPDDEEYLMQLVPVRGDYFGAMGIPVVRGRAFRPGDGQEGDLVTIVNESFAEKAWPGQDPLGKRLRKGSGDEATLIEVVGVVPDQTMQSLAEDPLMQSFWPHDAVPWARELYFTVRTAGDPLALVPSVRQALARVDERVPVAEVSTMTGRVRGQLAGPRFRTVLVAGFAGAAALLALLGVYGVTSFVVARRSHEIGVRMALGARKAQVRFRVLARGAALALAGAVLGVAGAAAGSRILESMLFRTESLDAPVYMGAAALILTATLAATWLPARRASAVDPAEALRAE